MASLFIHIGMPKTGSTSIQAAFASGRERLRDHGIGYLSLGKSHERILGALFGRLKEGRGLHKDTNKILGLARDALEFDKAALARLFDDELAANAMPKFVMSGEGLFQFSREPIARMKEHLSRFFDEFRIIVYVRDPTSWASSWAQQTIKNGVTTLARLCDANAIAAAEFGSLVPWYRAGIEPYVDVFGREAVDIRVFDRGRFAGGDLIADFCAALGEPGLAAGLSGSIMNPSLSYEAVLLIDAYNSRLAASEGKVSRPKVVAFRKRLEGLGGTRFVLPKETLERVWAAAADDVAWLRDAMGEAVFAEIGYPPEAMTGPAWSAATLEQIVAAIEAGAALGTTRVKPDRQTARQAGEADASADRRKAHDLPEATIRQLRNAFGGSAGTTVNRTVEDARTGRKPA